MSSFWMNVKKAILFKELEIKELAYKANVPYSTIINGMNKNSMPHADIALKISKVLNMSLESLLGDVEIKPLNESSLTQENLAKIEIALYRKNKRIIDALEELPSLLRDSVEELIVKIRYSMQG